MLVSELSVVTTAFLLGLAGSAHCMGMCGGIAGALGLATDKQRYARWVIVLAYNIGRTVSYVFICLLFFTLLHGLLHVAESQLPVAQHFFYLRVIAGLLMVAMGMYLAQWWMGLTYLERIGQYVWRYIQPMGQTLFPVNSPGKALMLGMVWGWLPCGLVYSALAYAVVQPTAGLAATTMLAFALGTVPAMLATGVAASQFLPIVQRPAVRRWLGIIVIAFGLWTACVALYHGLAPGHQHSAAAHEHMDMEDTGPVSKPAASDHHHH